MSKCQTIYLSNALEDEEAMSLYNLLKEGVEWGDGIKTRTGGFTRKAHLVDVDSATMEMLSPYICKCVSKLAVARLEKEVDKSEIATYTEKELTLRLQSIFKYVILGAYLNYYEDGKMYTPVHSHPQQHQLVISLGASRTLTIGKKEYTVKNGSTIIFGSSPHGVPQEPGIKDGRISIAVFMSPIHDTVYERPVDRRGVFKKEDLKTVEEDVKETSPSNHSTNGIEDFSFVDAFSSSRTECDLLTEQSTYVDSQSNKTDKENTPTVVDIQFVKMVDTSHLPVHQRVSVLTQMFGDKDDRRAIVKEINEYLKEAENDLADQKDFFDELEKRDLQARYDYLNEWRSDDIEATLFANLSEDTSILEERMFAMYFVNGLTRGGEKRKPATRRWARKKVKEYAANTYALIRACEKRHNLEVLGVKWEKQLSLREQHAYCGPYLLDDDGYVSVEATYE